MNPLPSFVLSLLLASPTGAATVVSVGDGDTFRVNSAGNALTIRLACIDAPETAQRPYGASSRRTLQELLPIGSILALRNFRVDHYGRTVAEVFNNGRNVNLMMVIKGAAFTYPQYLGSCNHLAYLEAEGTAQRRGLGVWAVTGGIQRPWDFRNGTRLSCQEIGSFTRAQELLRQGHKYLDYDNDGIACEILR